MLCDGEVFSGADDEVGDCAALSDVLAGVLVALSAFCDPAVLASDFPASPDASGAVFAVSFPLAGLLTVLA